MASWTRAIPLVVGVGIGTFLLLSATNASAATDLSQKARSLLEQSGYSIVLSPDSAIAMIALGPTDPSVPNAIVWAKDQSASGRVVLVPTHMVDGKKRPDDKGLPTNVLGLSKADADELLRTGLYVRAAV